MEMEGMGDLSPASVESVDARFEKAHALLDAVRDAQRWLDAAESAVATNREMLVAAEREEAAAREQLRDAQIALGQQVSPIHQDAHRAAQVKRPDPQHWPSETTGVHPSQSVPSSGR